jgi:hypothetical protein
VPPVKAEQPPPRRDTAKPLASGYRGVLVLNSSPEGAEVMVNGSTVGRTPLVIDDLPVGSRAVVVRREGYSSWSSSVRIVANERTIVSATLVPMRSGD